MPYTTFKVELDRTVETREQAERLDFLLESFAGFLDKHKVTEKEAAALCSEQLRIIIETRK